jgi:RNA polymerase sigma-70 factor (ECF subfamily)
MLCAIYFPKAVKVPLFLSWHVTFSPFETLYDDRVPMKGDGWGGDTRRLVRATLAGDKAAFGNLWSQHQDLLRRMARRMVRNGASAEDLVQESCLRAYLGLRGLKDPSLFKAWSIGILINVFREWRRSSERRLYSFGTIAELTGGSLFFEAGGQDSATEDPAILFESSELRRLLVQSVMELPTTLRRSALLFYFDGMSVSEAAIALGVTPEAFKMRLSRAKSLLRERLRPA